MKAFLRSYWAYIVVPLVIVAAVVLALAVLSDDPAGAFYYNH